MNFSSQSFIALLRRRASLNVMVPKKQLLWKRRQENSSPPSSSSFFFEIFCPKFRQTGIRFSLSFFSIIADSIQLKQQNLEVVVSVVTVRKDCYTCVQVNYKNSK